MSSLYGGDFNVFSQNGFVWSQAARLTVKAPQATLAGTYYIGSMLYSQLSSSPSI